LGNQTQKIRSIVQIDLVD
jgi:hypothetical protein